MKPWIAAALLLLGAYWTVAHSASNSASMNVLTRQNGNSHTGGNLHESLLTTSNVNSTSFGKLFSYPVDGQIYGEPLYVQNVHLPSGEVHNVVYIVTENDSVYAFDADSAKLNPSPLWFVNFTDPAAKITTLPCEEGTATCVIRPVVGITGTPVIDLANHTMYLVARTKIVDVNLIWSFATTIHALDIRSGAEQTQMGSPAVICKAVTKTACTLIGQITETFEVQHQNNRPALLLVPAPGFSQGVLYMGFAGTEGWIIAYDASNLKPVASWASHQTSSGGTGQGYGVPVPVLRQIQPVISMPRPPKARGR